MSTENNLILQYKGLIIGSLKEECTGHVQIYHR